MSKAYFVSSVWQRSGGLCLSTSLVRDVKNEEEAFGVHFNNNKDELMSDGFVYMMHDCMEVSAEDLVADDLKVGDVLEAIDVCIMDVERVCSLTIGKRYTINSIKDGWFSIKSDIFDIHEFEVSDYSKCFKKV